MNWMNGWRERHEGEPLRDGPSELQGTVGLYNPAAIWEPRPEPEVECLVISGFCLGGGKDLCPGEHVRVEGRRARHLARNGFVEIIVDRKAEAAAKAAAVRKKVEAAKRIASAPAPAPPLPTPTPEPPVSESVRVRVLKAFCLGGGRDVEAGVVKAMSIEDAMRRMRGGLVEIIEEPEPGA